MFDASAAVELRSQSFDMAIRALVVGSPTLFEATWVEWVDGSSAYSDDAYDFRVRYIADSLKARGFTVEVKEVDTDNDDRRTEIKFSWDAETVAMAGPPHDMSIFHVSHDGRRVRSVYYRKSEMTPVELDKLALCMVGQSVQIGPYEYKRIKN